MFGAFIGAAFVYACNYAGRDRLAWAAYSAASGALASGVALTTLVIG